jgi:hypothetical protein
MLNIILDNDVGNVKYHFFANYVDNVIYHFGQ